MSQQSQPVIGRYEHAQPDFEKWLHTLSDKTKINRKKGSNLVETWLESRDILATVNFEGVHDLAGTAPIPRWIELALRVAESVGSDGTKKEFWYYFEALTDPEQKTIKRLHEQLKKYETN